MPERTVPDGPWAASNINKTGNPVDEKDDKPDRYGEWLADDARIWRVYERLAKLDDDEKVKRWSGGLNNLALFATLFAGITTAFIIESQGDLKPDFAELAYRVQNATAHGRPYVEEPFVVPGQARTVNCLWIASLLLSLSAALIAVMGQDWVEMYVDKPVCNPRQWAEIRSFRLNGVRRWYMPGVIATAPVLLHASFFLFGIGLAVFMASDVTTQNLCIALCVIVVFLYAVTMFSAVFWSSSPFRSPATMLVRRWFCTRFQHKGDNGGSLSENSARRYITHSADTVCRWSKNRLSGRWAAYRRTFAHYLLRISNACLTVSRRWSRAGGNHGICPSDGRPAHDPEAPVSVSASQNTAPGQLPIFLSMSRTTFSTIRADLSPKVSSPWTVFCQWLSVTSRYGHAVLRWVRDRYARSRITLSSILDKTRPDFSNGWSDIRETPSSALVADSLSWLSSASSSPEVTRLVVAGLCDNIIGTKVTEHANSQSLTQKLRQYADDHWEHMSVLDLSRFVIISANSGQRDWEDRVKQRFAAVLDADSLLPQDFLLAHVHLTSGLQVELQELSRSSYTGSFEELLARFERLGARILDRSPITPTTIASMISRFTSVSNFDRNGTTIMTLPVLIHTWCDSLPTDLRPIERVLREVLPSGAVEHANKLTTLCQSHRNRPIDNILHLLLAFPSQCYGEGICGRTLRNLALFFARAASGSGEDHSCLAALLGNSDPNITQAAWSELPAHEIEWALDITCSDISVDQYHADLQPMLARMIARCISPPFSLLTCNISARAPLLHGLLLFDLIEAMSGRRASLDDLFHPVLESGALANLAASLREEPADTSGDSHFFWILGAIALWIKARSDVEDRRKLFELFAESQTTRASDDPVWDLVDALGTALVPQGSEIHRYFWSMSNFPHAAKSFMFVMKALREMFPGPNYTVWADIALRFGASRHHFTERDLWEFMRKIVRDGTGVDPWTFVHDNLSPAVSTAVQEVDSPAARSARTIELTGDGAGADIIAHPMPRNACIVACGISHGGP